MGAGVDRVDQRQALTSYCRARMRREEAAHGRGYQAELARKSGLTTATIANIVNERNGVGMDAAESLAKAWGLTYEQLLVESKEWARSAPEDQRTSKATARTARANLETAIELASRAGALPVEVLAEARELGSSARRDYSVAAWMHFVDEILRAHAAQQEQQQRTSSTVRRRRT